MNQSDKSLLDVHLLHEQIYKSLFQSHPDAIFLIDTYGRYKEVNSAFERMSGYTINDLKSMTFQQVVGKENVGITEHHFAKALIGESQNYENMIMHKNQTRFTTSVTLVPIKNDKSVIGVFGVIQDITSRKKTEEKLRKSETSLAQAQRIARLGSWELESDTDIFYWSDELFRIFGLEPKEFITQEEILGLIHPDDRDNYLNSIEEIKRGIPNDIIIRIKRPDGQLKFIRTLRTITETGELFGTGQDITEQKQTEELLLKSEKLAVLGELAAGIGHEIRNPLTAIQGFIQLLQSKVAGFNRYFDIMLSELNRINSIVSELMYLAKPQAIRYKSVNIQNLFDDILSLLAGEATLNNIQISTRIEAKSPLITCEENQMKQVFINLLKNAIESMPDGGDVRIVVRNKEEKLIITIRDEGCGIPEDRIPKLGEPFYSTKEKGNGLGLMVSHKIIENHHGKIEITSEVGKGTSIDVILPA